MGISRAHRIWTTTLAAGIVACGGRTAPLDEPAPADRPPPAPVPMQDAFVLESWGVPPEDTTVTFPAFEPRVILIRRGAPDNSVFAELRLPPGSILPPPGRSTVAVTLRPRPGLFGLEILLEPGASMEGPAELLFSYAVHFVMPEEARARYGTAIAFERGLFVAELRGAGELRFLRSRRPASDVLTATIQGPGVFLVAMPR